MAENDYAASNPDKEFELFRPIIILGAARSGTTLLAETILSSHRQIIYWNEPGFVWKAGFSYRADDMLGPDEVSEGYMKFVKDAFCSRMRDAPQGSRFMEKTPSNCLRVGAILKIFPDAQFIHVIRDGRAVALSAAKEWTAQKSDALDSKELRAQKPIKRLFMTILREADFRDRFRNWRTILDLPAYALRLVQTVLRQTFHTTKILWGPRVPGLREIRRSYSLLVTCAIQWAICTVAARAAGHNLSPSQYIELRFEDLLEDPGSSIERITDYLELQRFPLERVEEIVKEIRIHKETWRERYTEKNIALVERHIGIFLKQFGYVDD